jgi:threonine synthase
VVVLYPDGRVSPRQAHQLTCFGDNVRAFPVSRQLRRLPAAGEVRPAPMPRCSRRAAGLGQQHQPGPAAAADDYYAHASLMHWREHATR